MKTKLDALHAPLDFDAARERLKAQLNPPAPAAPRVTREELVKAAEELGLYEQQKRMGVAHDWRLAVQELGAKRSKPYLSVGLTYEHRLWVCETCIARVRLPVGVDATWRTLEIWYNSVAGRAMSPTSYYQKHTMLRSRCGESSYPEA